MIIGPHFCVMMGIFFYVYLFINQKENIMKLNLTQDTLDQLNELDINLKSNLGQFMNTQIIDLTNDDPNVKLFQSDQYVTFNEALKDLNDLLSCLEHYESLKPETITLDANEDGAFYFELSVRY